MNTITSYFSIVKMDCPVCASAKGLKDREELVEHMKTHKNNPDLLIERFADYVAAREISDLSVKGATINFFSN